MQVIFKLNGTTILFFLLFIFYCLKKNKNVVFNRFFPMLTGVPCKQHLGYLLNAVIYGRAFSGI